MQSDGGASALAGFGNWQAFSVLVVDDEEGMRNFLERALKSRCGLVEAVGDVEHAAQLMARLHFDLIVLDISLPGKSGVEWLHELRESGFAGDVILITAFADMETAINALRGGASDFILKPFRVDQILNSIKRCFERARLARENFVLRRELAELGTEVDGLVGHSLAIQHLRGLIKRIAPMPTTVLLQGESGTGKEVTARALHQMSQRATRPFVPVNCAAITAELIESELFGHVKGAFTGAHKDRAGYFEAAADGTVFLDEIGEIPLALQKNLLRVLEQKTFTRVGENRRRETKARIVAATNRNLGEEVKAGRFREDLYYRLNVVELSIPPLRDRSEDIRLLVRHYLNRLNRKLNRTVADISPAALDLLRQYRWPGNVRELVNLLEQVMTFHNPAILDVEHLPKYLQSAGTALPSGTYPDFKEQVLEEAGRGYFLSLLSHFKGNVTQVADYAGINRRHMHRLLHLLGLDPSSYRNN